MENRHFNDPTPKKKNRVHGGSYGGWFHNICGGLWGIVGAWNKMHWLEVGLYVENNNNNKVKKSIRSQ
ncbi:hypothetical protein H8356DRAFT_1426337 [Neocallimastix lanati (nom. inval.)]|nr:hypothetical protein H8356DRAFT_1426337 [Neocallimastix sp. JGI-2020a]